MFVCQSIAHNLFILFYFIFWVSLLYFSDRERVKERENDGRSTNLKLCMYLMSLLFYYFFGGLIKNNKKILKAYVFFSLCFSMRERESTDVLFIFFSISVMYPKSQIWFFEILTFFSLPFFFSWNLFIKFNIFLGYI